MGLFGLFGGGDLGLLVFVPLFQQNAFHGGMVSTGEGMEDAGLQWIRGGQAEARRLQ